MKIKLLKNYNGHKKGAIVNVEINLASILIEEKIAERAELIDLISPQNWIKKIIRK